MGWSTGIQGGRPAECNARGLVMEAAVDAERLSSSIAGHPHPHSTPTLPSLYLPCPFPAALGLRRSIYQDIYMIRLWPSKHIRQPEFDESEARAPPLPHHSRRRRHPFQNPRGLSIIRRASIPLGAHRPYHPTPVSLVVSTAARLESSFEDIFSLWIRSPASHAHSGLVASHLRCSYPHRKPQDSRALHQNLCRSDAHLARLNVYDEESSVPTIPSLTILVVRDATSSSTATAGALSSLPHLVQAFSILSLPTPSSGRVQRRFRVQSMDGRIVDFRADDLLWTWGFAVYVASMNDVWRLLRISRVLLNTVGLLLLLVWIVATASSILRHFYCRATSLPCPCATALETTSDSFLLGPRRFGERATSMEGFSNSMDCSLPSFVFEAAALSGRDGDADAQAEPPGPSHASIDPPLVESSTFPLPAARMRAVGLAEIRRLLRAKHAELRSTAVPSAGHGRRSSLPHRLIRCTRAVRTGSVFRNSSWSSAKILACGREISIQVHALARKFMIPSIPSSPFIVLRLQRLAAPFRLLPSLITASRSDEGSVLGIGLVWRLLFDSSNDAPFAQRLSSRALRYHHALWLDDPMLRFPSVHVKRCQSLDVIEHRHRRHTFFTLPLRPAVPQPIASRLAIEQCNAHVLRASDSA
ncbi:hypothetical protein R3P38DRAFT_3277715 [Favolaschia claudopus]|uniref:Uncharacterized protein n=1 Tax=Favolaschia claudopus TaxID=2862362 RepID=A0AAW0ANE6_9AGAR